MPKDELSPMDEARRWIANLRGCGFGGLSLEGLGLTELPEELFEVRDLLSLDLKGNSLTRLPERLGEHHWLCELFVSQNHLEALPQSLGRLSVLQVLDLGSNRLETLPDIFGRMVCLHKLLLFGNCLSTLPGSLGDLNGLGILWLTENRFTEFPTAIKRMTGLRELYLGGNALEAIPDWLEGLSNLELLDLSSNRLRALPESMRRMEALEALFLHGNALLGIPPEVLGGCERDSFFRQRQPTRPSEILGFHFKTRTARPLNEVRMLIVGNVGSGKSSMQERLTPKKCGGLREIRAEGIHITHWPLKCGKEEVRIHLWDFGDREIERSTHRFFLTERCVYLLMLDVQAETQVADAEYWLQTIAALGKDSPIIVVLNDPPKKPSAVAGNAPGGSQKAAGGRPESFAIDQQALRERYPAIRAFLKPIDMSVLAGEIARLLEGWEDVHRSIPETWWRVKEHYVHHAHWYETFGKFRETCAGYGMKDPGEQEQVARMLRDLGVILHYPDDPRLRHLVMPDPHGLAFSVGKLLQRHRPDTVMTMDDATNDLFFVPRETVGDILALMQRFGLCSPLDEAGQRWQMSQLPRSA